MKIKFKNFSRAALGKHRPGSIEDLPEAEALVFLNQGYAEPVPPAPAERAELPAAASETAADPAAAPVEPPAPAAPAAEAPAKKKKKKRK